MALDKTGLESDLKSLLTDMLDPNKTSTATFAERLSKAIDNYVKKAQVKYTAGSLVAPPTGGVVTAPTSLIGKLS